MHLSDFSFRHMKDGAISQSEVQLVTAARAGSHLAFAEMHRLYGHRLYKRIHSITKNHEDAEDVLQETMMRVYLALESFEGRSQLLSWLTRIAINTSLMALRKRRVRHEATLDSWSLNEEGAQIQVMDPKPSPEETYMQAEKRSRVIRAVAGLKPALRAVVQLQMSEECSLKEMAGSLDVSVATVKARLHRARKRLAQRVESEATMRESRARTSSR